MNNVQKDFKFVSHAPLQEIEKGQQSLEPLWQQAISHPPGLTTGISTSELTDSQEVSKRSGVLWECVGRQKAPHQGWIYQFRLRKQFESNCEITIKAAMQNIFPGVESGGNDPIADAHMFTSTVKQKRYSRQRLYQKPYSSSFQRLGYKSQATRKGLFLYLPDAEALKGSWEKLYPKYPELKVQSSEGIATNQVFIKAVLENHALLSCDKEFIHDHILHLAPTINLLISKKKFPEKRATFVEHLNTLNQLCLFGEELLNDETLTPEEKSDLKTYLPMLWSTLGYWTDTMAAFDDLRDFSDYLSNLKADFFYILSVGFSWRFYFSSQFSEPTEELLTKLELTLWNTIGSRWQSRHGEIKCNFKTPRLKNQKI